MSTTRTLLAKTKEGDIEARNTLVEENLGLVHHCLKRFPTQGAQLQDLFQIGTIGLIKAIDHFDLDREVAFSTYAVPMILGEIKRFLRDDGMVKVSRGLKEDGYRIRREKERFQKEFGREPLLSEISERTGLSMEAIVEATEAGMEVESIYASVYLNDGSQVCLGDKIQANGNEKEELLNHLVLEQLLAVLPEEEKKLIELRYLNNLTQVQVATKLGISQVQVSRMEKKILLKMRKAYFGTEKIKEKIF